MGTPSASFYRHNRSRCSVTDSEVPTADVTPKTASTPCELSYGIRLQPQGYENARLRLLQLARPLGEVGVEPYLHSADDLDEMALESDGPIDPTFNCDSGSLVEQRRPGTPQHTDGPVDANYVLERNRNDSGFVTCSWRVFRNDTPDDFAFQCLTGPNTPYRIPARVDQSHVR